MDSNIYIVPHNWVVPAGSLFTRSLISCDSGNVIIKFISKDMQNYNPINGTLPKGHGTVSLSGLNSCKSLTDVPDIYELIKLLILK